MKFDVRYRYRVVVVHEKGKRLQRSRWNRAIVLSPDTERLHLRYSATDFSPKTDSVSDAAEADLLVEIKPVFCKWKRTERFSRSARKVSVSSAEF